MPRYKDFVEGNPTSDLSEDGVKFPLLDENGDNAEATLGALKSAIATSPELTAQFVTGGAVTQEFINRIRQDQTDVSLLILGDSTTSAGNGWARLLTASLGALYPTHSVEYRAWVTGSPGSYASAVAVTTGTGTHKITVWIGAYAGQTWPYFLEPTRIAPIAAAPLPHLVLLSLGHNDNNTLVDSANPRGFMVRSVETLREQFQSAPLVIVGQNPLEAYPTATERRSVMYRALCREQGYGFVDVCQAFHDDGRAIFDDLVDTDGIHPTTAGYELWRDTVLPIFQPSPVSVAPITMQPPAFLRLEPSITANPIFATVDGSNLPTIIPAAAVNLTSALETTIKETGAHSLRLTKVAASASYLTLGLPLALVKGRWVTIAVRMYIATGVNGNAGQLAIRQTSGITSADVGAGAGYGWVWRTVSEFFASTTAISELRIYVDPSTAASAEIYIDRMWVGYGEHAPRGSVVVV